MANNREQFPTRTEVFGSKIERTNGAVQETRKDGGPKRRSDLTFLRRRKGALCEGQIPNCMLFTCLLCL